MLKSAEFIFLLSQLSIIFTMGSVLSTSYSVPDEARDLLYDGILNNPSMSDLPSDLCDLAKLVHFEGNATPSIPINWRLAESISALKALEATLVNAILKRKYSAEPVKVVINTEVSLNFNEAYLTLS
jgi:hypothetical protein